MLHKTSINFGYKMDIVQLLTRLASLTPKYPVHLMCERRIAFLERVSLLSIETGSVHRGTKALT